MNNQKDIINMVTVLSEQYGKQVTAPLMKMFTSVLSKYSTEDIKNAIDSHTMDTESGMFFPMPANLIKFIQINDGRPTSDEAFLNTPTSEYESVSWTAETREAYFSVCNDLGHSDRVALRMAFKPAYERIIQANRLNSVPVIWENNLGLDKLGREETQALTRDRNYQINKKDNPQLMPPKKKEILPYLEPEKNTWQNKEKGISCLKEIMEKLDKDIEDEKSELTRKHTERAKKATEFFG
ncbi:MAG: hypothetical protein KAG20_11480 [Cocleimonas sp.]|nr:hypothetical protein [Cocleimonas sp.]